MNILVFSWRDPKHPLAGGAEQVMHEHMKGWLEKGHRVTLFSSRFKGSLKEEEIDGVKIVRSGNQYHLGVQFAGFLYYFRNRNLFDLLIDQFHGMPFFTPLYSAKPKIAVLQEVTKEVWFLNPFPKPINWIYGFIGYFLEPLVFKLYKNVCFIVGSLSAKKDLISFSIQEENINIVPHGVIVKKPNPFPKKESKKTILFLGALTTDKGVEDAIRAFYIMSKSGDYKFWVVGKGEASYIQYLKKLTEKLGIAKNTQFWGFVSLEKKFELLAKSHVLLNPSVREGWGLVNIEANSMGTPVVAYNAPGLVDSVKDNESGIICKSNTPQYLADQTNLLLSDPELYAKLQKGANQWSENFSWGKSRKLSLRVIEKVLNG